MRKRRREGREHHERLARLKGERYLRCRMERCESGVSASDILQTVELKVAGPLKAVPDEQIIPFYMRAVANALTDHIRHQAAKRKHLTKQTLGSAEETPTKSSGPLASLTREEDQEVLQRALQALPEDQRQLIVLKHVEAVTMEAAAERLSLSKETFRRKYHQALRAFRREFERLNGNG